MCIIDRLKSKLRYVRVREMGDDCYRCPFCGNVNLVLNYKTFELVCPRCGSVVAERLVDFEHPEYRLTENRDVEHYFPVIDAVPVVTYTDNSKLSRIASKTLYSKTRALSQIRDHCKRFSPMLNIPEYITNTAIKLASITYSKLHSRPDRKIMRLSFLALASLYVACFIHGKTELCNAVISESDRLGYRRLKFWDIVQLVAKYCNVKLVVSKRDRMRRIIVMIEGGVKELCKTYKCSDEIYDRARKLAIVLAHKILDVAPARPDKTIAALATYIALRKILGNAVTQKKITFVFGASDATLRENYRKLTPVLETLENNN